MSRKRRPPDLAGKTFDQQLSLTGGTIEGHDISPNTVIDGHIIFEPLPKGVRVSAYDDEFKLLWGFIGAKEMLELIHCPVAIYDTLKNRIASELKRQHQPSPLTADPLIRARESLDALEESLGRLRKLIDVTDASEATRARAETIAVLASDAVRMMTLGVPGLKAVPNRADPRV